MNNAMASLSDGKRLAVSIAIVALVHLFLLRSGNEGATPSALSASFAIAVALLIVAQRLRRRLIAPHTPARKP